jgi:hypothetical protein
MFRKDFFCFLLRILVLGSGFSIPVTFPLPPLYISGLFFP